MSPLFGSMITIAPNIMVSARMWMVSITGNAQTVPAIAWPSHSSTPLFQIGWSGPCPMGITRVSWNAGAGARVVTALACREHDAIRYYDAQVDVKLTGLISILEPALIVASGDLSHRGRSDQIARAAGFLRSLGPPVLAVPGNHDIPYSFPARFTTPFREFDAQWETTEPTYSSDDLHVIGLNSVRTPGS